MQPETPGGIDPADGVFTAMRVEQGSSRSTALICSDARSSGHSNSEAVLMPDQILNDIIREYLPYEIDMLRLTHKQLEGYRAREELLETDPEKVVRLALIESFCVHARSLIHFFSNTRSKRTDSISSDFIDGCKTGFDVEEDPLKSILYRLNKQIFHLTKDRTVVQEEKFNVGSDGVKVLELVEREIANFKKCIRPGFPPFECKTDNSNIEQMIFSAFARGATGPFKSAD